MKVRDLLREGTDKLNKAGIDNAAYDARQLLMRAYGKTNAELLADLNRELCAGATGGQEPQNITYCPGDCGARIDYDDFIARRAKHVPLQHILGTASFMGLEFRVSKDVLIPRQDTELLVETVLSREKEDCSRNPESQRSKFKRKCSETNSSVPSGNNIENVDETDNSGNAEISGAPDDAGAENERGKANGNCAKNDAAANNISAARGLSILDLCTGSGCIAIALKKLGAYSQVAASDYSKAALEVARDNARENGTDISFIYSNMFDAIDETFDIIVSNPPYIPSSDMEGLQPEVRDHDPKAALDGGSDGLHFYRIIAKEAGARLNAGGRLYLEIGYDQAEAVSALLKNNGYLDIEVLKDLNDKDRVVACRLSC